MIKEAIAERMAVLQTEKIMASGGTLLWMFLKSSLLHSKGIQDNYSFSFSYNVSICLEDAAETF